MSDNIPSVLPPLYASWIDQLLQGPIPPETKATCFDCAMCAKGAEASGDSRYFFRPNVKCCSYLPELHNFLVGRILEDDDPALAQGRVSVLGRIQKGVAVTPLGLGRSPAADQIYTNHDHAFGRILSLRCPHYLEADGGRCGIWRHREAICSTYFCKTVRGTVGANFWSTIKQLIRAIEKDLAYWCVLNLDLGVEAVERLFSSTRKTNPGKQIDKTQLDGVINLESQRLLWGKWLGREKEFYVECARLVNPLTWQDVLAICRPSTQAYAQIALESYKKLMSNEIPARLKVGPYKVIHVDKNICRINPYGFEYIELQQSLVNVLHYFDGRSTHEALGAIAAEGGVQLGEEVIRRLVDFKVLVACN